jgi:nitrate/nitrite transport system ATP-binding protein
MVDWDMPPTGVPPSLRAACASAWPLHELAINPEFCCSTNRCRRWTLTRAKLQDEIEAIWRGEKTVVLVTNDVDEALLLADHHPSTPGPCATLGPSSA